MPTSPAATTMPGGAPLKASRSRASSRPCKYGPRDADGRCPKKPKSSSTKPSTAAAKRPCKYGARIDGRCPPKPKAAKKDKAPQVKDYKSVDSAARQAGEVLRSKKATKQQKHEAVKVLGTAVAGEATKKVGESVYREAKKAARQNKTAIKAAAKKVLTGGAATAGATGVGIAATLYAGGKALDANRRREARAFAASQLALTKKRLAPQQLTKQQADTLYQQYYEHALKQPVQNPYLGK